MANEIFDVVDGSRTRPADAEGTNTGRTKTWIKDNAKATAIIASAMEDEQVNSVLVCGSAKEMWDKLITMHEQKSASNVGSMTQRFYSYQMSPTDLIIRHVSTVQNMARQLTDVGEKLSDAAVITKILSSLTGKFHIFKTAWDSVDPERQTITNLLERLLREEKNLREEDDSTNALVVTKQSGSKSESHQKEKDKKKKKSKKNIECYRCQERGHYASQCDKRKSHSEKNNIKGQPNSGCAFVVTSHEKGKSALVVNRQGKIPGVGQFQELRDADSKDVWITDSGASEHVTSRREWFEELRPITRETRIGGRPCVRGSRCRKNQHRKVREWRMGKRRD